MALGDLDGDGKLDLVLGNGNGSLSILLGNGDGTFHPPSVTVAQPGQVSALVLADFDGDGVLDIAAGIDSSTNGNPVPGWVECVWEPGMDSHSMRQAG